MKKSLSIILLSVALIIFGSSYASADLDICGTITNIHYMKIYESNALDDPPPCDVIIDFTHERPDGTFQSWSCLPVKAYGTQLNLALLKFYNDGGDYPLSTCLTIVWNPATQEFDLKITEVDVPEVAPCLPVGVKGAFLNSIR
jgi:hypothetical protein